MVILQIVLVARIGQLFHHLHVQSIHYHSVVTAVVAAVIAAVVIITQFIIPLGFINLVPINQ